MPLKGEKITDSATLERLAKMREKALATRQAKAKQKQDVKMAERLTENQKVAEAQETIKRATSKPTPEPERQPEPEPISEMQKSKIICCR